MQQGMAGYPGNPQAMSQPDGPTLDVFLSSFSAHDSTVGSMIGRNSKVFEWTVDYDRNAAPIDIKLTIQERKLHTNEVGIEVNGRHIFSGAGSHTTAPLHEDFRYQWPLQAVVWGIKEVDFFETWHLQSGRWCPATITRQYEDGNFEVLAKEPDGNGGSREVPYSCVTKAMLREAATQKAIVIAQNTLVLEVPKSDPLKPKLSVARGELKRARLCPTPTVKPTQTNDVQLNQWGLAQVDPQPPQAEVVLKVSKDRRMVTASVGHTAFSRFLTEDINAANTGRTDEIQRLHRKWTVQIGPFEEHTIELAKKYTVGKIVTLLVDGKVLAEASPADLGLQKGDWKCEFQFVSERVLEFEVHKSNKDGVSLDAMGHVKQTRKTVHNCVVMLPSDTDFKTAQLIVNGVYFNELPIKPNGYAEPPLSMEPTVLQHSYGINIPYMVDGMAPSGMAGLANSLFAQATGTAPTAAGGAAGGGLFAWCCNGSSVNTQSEQYTPMR